jgi:ketosteroid isomerase-like protein
VSENLDLVRSIYADWERGDFSRADWADSETEYVMVDGPAPGRWTGPAGMARAWREILSAVDDVHLEADEYRELDGERVLVLNHGSGRGKASRLEIDQVTGGASVFHVRGGRVKQAVFYFDRCRALADLGLSE